MALTTEKTSDVKAFLANLNQAMYRKETVMIGGGQFEGDELLALRDVLRGVLNGESVTAPVSTVMANIKHAIRNRETVSLGGGDFSRQELTSVLDALNSQIGE